VLAAQRRRLILRTVRSDHGVQVVDLAQRFGVSEMTVRRDLSQLQREGKLTRVHGGAVSEAEEPPFAAIAIERRDAKERVGRAAADLVEDGRTIMIDIGTTTLELARALRGRELTVITTNLAVVEELMPDPRIELVLLGASGIRSEDLAVMDTTMVEVPIKRGMIASARRSILLVDAAKFAQGGVVRVCPIDELDGIVTDADASDPLVHRIQRAGVEVFPA
jgi:DeoR/GlpR family transcriptional regulator of sugar metabolism